MSNIAILFPGQGAQYPGMGKSIYMENRIVREVFEEASDILHRDMVKLCFESSLETLTRTENAQISVFVVSFACYKILEEAGVVPNYLLGNSLGEFTALTSAGAVTFEEGLKIVLSRGRLMQVACDLSDSGMIAINGVDAKTVEDLCLEFKGKGKYVDVTNYNSPLQVVIAGTNNVLDEVIVVLEQRKYSFKRLVVNGAFHSSLMQSTVEQFRSILQKCTFHEIKIPVISNVTAKEYSKENIIKNLSEHLVSPVRWSESINLMKTKGIDVFVEAGTKSILGKFAKDTYGKELKYVFFDPSKSMEMISRLCDVCFVPKDQQLDFAKYINNVRKIENTSLKLCDIKSFINDCLKFSIAMPNVKSRSIESQYKALRKYAMYYDEDPEKITSKDLVSMYKGVFNILCLKGIDCVETDNIMNKLCQNIESK